jgi:hypothetical protein
MPSIDSDIICAACGYNLRGLGIESVCPECGTSIQQSLAAIPMMAWRRTFRKGAVALAIAIVVLLIFSNGFFYTRSVRQVLSQLHANTEGTEMVLQAAALLPAALWLTRSQPPGRSRLMYRRPITLSSIAILFALGVNNLFAYNSYSATAGVLLLSGYALGPLVFAACIFWIFGPIADAADVVTHSLPRWVVQAVRGLLTYAILSPALGFAVINFARMRYRGAVPTSGYWVDRRLSDWMQNWLFTPGYRMLTPV